MKLRNISKLGLSKGKLLITIGIATGIAFMLWLNKNSKADLFNFYKNETSRHYRGKRKVGKKVMYQYIRRIEKEEADNDKYNLWI